jgi:hypothetical protein
VGIDIGAGGKDNHPSTISFIAVAPDFSVGFIYKHWRGDEEVTTMSDVANVYLQLKGATAVNGAYYDYHAKDFKTITDRMGLSFIMAEKNHQIGEQTLNTLFNNKMLFIFDTPECQPIIQEFLSIQSGVDKRHLHDDSVDSVRYGVTKIPWDWTKANITMQTKQEPKQILTRTEIVDQARRADADRMFQEIKDQNEHTIEQDYSYYNSLYE